MKFRFLCWWFGCDANFEYALPNDINCPCIRCAGEVSYADIVGDTRHNRFKEWCNYYLFRKWLPKKCSDCAKRYGHDENVEHIPF